MRLRLHTRFSLVIASVVVVLVVSLAAVFLYQSQRSMGEMRAANADLMTSALQDQALKQAAALSYFLEESITNPLYSFELDVMGQLLASIREQNEVIAAYVYDESGLVIHDGSDDLLAFGKDLSDGMAAKAKESRSVVREVHDGTVIATAPIYIGSRYLGGVRVVLSLESIIADIATAENQMTRVAEDWASWLVQAILIAVVFFLVLGVAVGVMVGRNLSRPIEALVTYTREIGEGRYEGKISSKRSDEIGELTEAVNEMAVRRIRAEERYAKASDAGRVGVWEWDLLTNRTYLSPSLRTMLGLGPEGSADDPAAWECRYHPDDAATAVQKAKAHIKGATPEFLGEHRVVLKDGSIRWFSSRGKVERDSDGRAFRMMGTDTDITERVLAEEQLRQFQKLESLGSLAGGMAHEINNMLHPIIALTEAALSALPAGSRERQRLEAVMEASERVEGLVEQILAFSRRSESAQGPIVINPVFLDTAKLLASTMPASVDFSYSIDGDPILVRIHPSELQTIIINLATNALDAIGANHAELDVSLTTTEMRESQQTLTQVLEPGSYASISIRDTGTGMDQETLHRVFDPFFTTKEVGEGAGMGLAIVYGIVTKRSGALDVSSQIGVGTVFEIYLPVAKPEPAVQAVDEPMQIARN